MKMRAQMKGINDVQRALGRRAANRLERRIGIDVGDGVERMADQAYDNAPVETGALRSSILANIYKISNKEYVFGTNLPYGRRQEYEHKTKGFYFHRAVWQETSPLQKKLVFTIRRTLGGG